MDNPLAMPKPKINIPEELRSFSEFLRENLTDALFALCNRSVLLNEKFQKWPASINKHHNWDGGLLQHTYQVAVAAKNICDQNHANGKSLDKMVVLTACVFHDFAKIYDYTPDIILSSWKKTTHYHRIHHVVSSYTHFMEMSESFKPHSNDFRHDVGHCMLAHHGRLEYGSPVTPQTQEAWAVHIADSISVFCIEFRKAEPNEK